MHTIQFRPRYAETDKGGVVHHSVYPVWLEMGRTELLRANKVAYSDLEESGIYFVVAEMSDHITCLGKKMASMAHKMAPYSAVKA